MKIFNIGSASSTRMANKAVKSKDLEQIDHAINTIVKKRQNLKSDLKKVGTRRTNLSTPWHQQEF